VRNSILLVDFSIHAIRRGESVEESVIQACKTRTRPIMITALALVAGSSVILSDPIFKGMAISLAFGVMVSTVLTLVVIPLGCISAADSLKQLAFAGSEGPSSPVPSAAAEPKPTPRPAFSTGLAARAKGVLSVLWLMVASLGRMTWTGLRKIARGAPKPAASRDSRTPPPATAARAMERASPAGGAQPAAQPAASGAPARPSSRPTPAPATEPLTRPAAARPSAARATVKPLRRAEPARAESAGPASIEPPAPVTELVQPRESATVERIPAAAVRQPPPEAQETPVQAPRSDRPPPILTTVVSVAAAQRGVQRKRRGIRLKSDVPGLDEDQTGAERG